MSNLKTNDKNILEKLFKMDGGYVLNFSNQTIDDFFKTDLSIDFYNEKYSKIGGSKGKILRYLFNIESDEVVAKVIFALIDYLENEMSLNNLKKDDYSEEIIEKGKDIASKLQGLVSPVSTLQFDENYINTKWEKAIQRLNKDDIEGAITIARTLIESVLKYILDDKGVDYDTNINLPKLYKSVQKSLNLAPEKHQEQIFKEILSGVSKVVNGLGNLRNQLGDSHAKSTNAIKPKERHGQLAVNLAGSMTIFLYKTHKEKC